jgi:hypothetical protein
LDYLLIPFLKKKPVSLICIVASPRSGSTLTYQFLTSVFENHHLTNLSNLLYATPILSAQIEKKVCKNYVSDFTSNQGFVDGVCGEAEGLKFWSYWMGQGLDEDPESLKGDKLDKLYNRLQYASGKPYITGYLGHVFSMDLLRSHFDKVLFIHLERDLLSNSYSLFKLSQNGLYSTKPTVCQQKYYPDIHEQVVDQITQIHKVIEKSTENDTLKISYEELCQDSNKMAKLIQKKAFELGIELKIKKEVDPFKVGKIDASLNADTQKLDRIIKSAQRGKPSANS